MQFLILYLGAGACGDLHVYDPVVQTWMDLSLLTSGLPSARWGLLIADAGARLYVHGGYASGEWMDKLDKRVMAENRRYRGKFHQEEVFLGDLEVGPVWFAKRKSTNRHPPPPHTHTLAN